MKSITQIGMDVHKNSFTVCCFDIESEQVKYTVTLEPDYKQVLKYIENIRKHYPAETEFECGYEAGCLGYSLYHQLTEHGVKCTRLAPTTMSEYDNKRFKTDKRDAANIAKCLAYHTYSKVYVPTNEDNAIKEYIRMRDDHKSSLKKIKQQILAFCLRFNIRYDSGKQYWTKTHIIWLNTIKLSDVVLQETLDEYLNTFNFLSNKIDLLDKRISEYAKRERYVEKVKRLVCLIGIKEHTAMAVLVEIGDFKRFAKADQFASYLGLVPGEHSSAENQTHLPITKAGNSHIRKLLIEAAHSYPRGKVGTKSKDLKKRQSGNTPLVIAYADKANERLRRKAYRLILTEKKKYNVAITAVARELACFIWGMMTDNIK